MLGSTGSQDYLVRIACITEKENKQTIKDSRYDRAYFEAGPNHDSDNAFTTIHILNLLSIHSTHVPPGNAPAARFH